MTSNRAKFLVGALQRLVNRILSSPQRQGTHGDYNVRITGSGKKLTVSIGLLEDIEIEISNHQVAHTGPLRKWLMSGSVNAEILRFANTLE